MTGYGEARAESDALNVAVEVRAVNNRFLKVTLRCPDAYHVLEAEIEKTVRRQVKRGSLQIQLSLRRAPRVEDFRLNLFAVRTYAEQLESLATQGLDARPMLAGVLNLPGVREEPDSASASPLDEWSRIEPVLELALRRLNAMREEEGRAMAAELRQYAADLGRGVSLIRQRVPEVVANYRERLREKITNLLAEQGLQPDLAVLIREVAIFAERTDIAEELTRLTSHLEQFSDMLGERESPGRKLDFLIQELVREVNTIGSKGNDVEIARQVVEMKGTVEKMRELVQNVE